MDDHDDHLDQLIGNGHYSDDEDRVSSDDDELQFKRLGVQPEVKPAADEAGNSKALLFSFLAMVVVGLGNKIFQVLQFIPMFNYPLFNNLLTTFIYMPASFAYIIPMIKYGKAISEESQRIPKRVFAVMGVLDSIAGIMQALSVNYIENGSLVILLSQAAIPTSMVISRSILKTRYSFAQYVGALVVACGLGIVLVPSFVNPSSTGNNVVLWSMVMIVSCVPMTLSSVYKEKALGDTEIDAVYMNGWIAVFQFLASIPLLLPSAPASNVKIEDLGTNLWNGARCYVGIDSITTGPHPDNCSTAPIYVNIYLMFNLGYNILIILILKHGSANILWLAMTVMVPLGNVSFALPFMPNHKPLKWTDILGLVVIMTGLLTYRFWASLWHKCCRPEKLRRARDKSMPSDVAPLIATPVIGADGKETEPGTPATPGTVGTPGRGADSFHTAGKKKKRSKHRDAARRQEERAAARGPSARRSQDV